MDGKRLIKSFILRGNMDIKDFKFKKRLGQNFIKDEGIIDKILDLSDIEDNSLVIEIGCGSGELTKKLIRRFTYVLGYEIDKELERYLSKLTSSNLSIIYDDFLKRNIKEDIKDKKYNKLYVISNLPYYITTPIIEKLINENIDIYRIVIMVQKEVGERINAKPNTKAYNSLSIFINYNFDVNKIANVSRFSFIPKPNVDSIVLKLSKKDKKYNPINEDYFYKIVRNSLIHKIKTLKDNLEEYNFKIVEEVLQRNNIPNNIRGEQLSIEMFVEISNALFLNK
jgi:16S rRNA (adenine1518-N6/adenine1519-N6)-dimethyltransferase